MKPSPPRQLLGSLLTGNIPSEADLKAFVAANQAEDPWFDCKAGALLIDLKPKAKIRQSVSGFACWEPLWG